MGRMHVQRAIQVAGGPAVIVCTDVSDLRLADLQESYGAEAAAKGIEFICLNPMNREANAEGMARSGRPASMMLSCWRRFRPSSRTAPPGSLSRV